MPKDVVFRFSSLRACHRDERGQDLIEYAVIATFVALLAVIGASALNAAVGTLYDSTSRNVNKGANFGTAGSVSTAPCDKAGADQTKTATTPTTTATTSTPATQTDDAHRPTCK